MERWKEEQSKVVRRTCFSLGTNKKKGDAGPEWLHEQKLQAPQPRLEGPERNSRGREAEREKREDIEGIVKRG